MNNSYEIDKLRVQQFGLTATIKDDSGKEHYFYRGHEYIEICGLKWAVTNIGAEKETDSGLYFAFGETQGYTAEQVRSGERKFNENEYTNVNFDSVNAYWGGKWRMATEAEFQALLHSANHGGMLFTDKTDWSKKLFFPAVGFCDYYGVNSVGYFSYYWSSSLYSNNVTYGRSLYLDNGYSSIKYNGRYIGFSVRGVIGE